MSSRGKELSGVSLGWDFNTGLNNGKTLGNSTSNGHVLKDPDYRPI